MRKIRVLVVDDAVVARRLVSDLIDSDPELEVVGVAANGKAALASVAQLSPDVVTLDVEMPVLDGLATLRELRRIRPNLPVIMLSALTSRGASVTVEALMLGANDYLNKPSDFGDAAQAMQQVRTDLIPKIKALCIAARSSAVRPTAEVPLKARAARPAVQLLAIGCSTGGPNALAQLLPRLPANLPVPIVIVQHMPPQFTRLLAERLDRVCAIGVEEAVAGVELRAGSAFIAPGDFHMRVQRGARPHLALDQSEPRHSCRPAVDALFESIAEVYGAGVLGVVLTGMGQDGLRGSERVRELGGDIIAQDEATSVVWGMPGFVARRGLASEVLPLDEIADAILRRIKGDGSAGQLRCESAP